MKISKQHAQHYIWGDQCDGWHLVQNKELSVIHERMPPGTSEVRHYHVHSQQFFFVLSGEAELEVNGETARLHAHEGVEVPPGIPHQMKNTSDADVEFLVISHPQTRGDRIAAD